MHVLIELTIGTFPPNNVLIEPIDVLIEPNRPSRRTDHRDHELMK